MKAELSPHVIIFANDLENYNKFSDLLSANAFPCQIFSQPSESLFRDPRMGTVFFVSFNLKSVDVADLVKRIEQGLHMTCIVFAESEDFQTAAKLSSAKMSQTLQHPYTQKNFLMAMQTLVRKRKEKFDKELRQRQHHERQKGPKLEVAQINGPSSRIFKNDDEPADDSGVIIQEGIEHLAAPSTLIYGEAPTPAPFILQKGPEGSSFFIIKEGPAPKGPPARTPEAPNRPEKKIHAEQSLDYEQPQEERPSSMKQATSSSLISETAKKGEAPKIPARREYTSLREELMNEYWAILCVVIVGTAVCGYCLYLTLFS